MRHPVLFLSLAVVAACGGGNTAAPTPPPPPPASQVPGPPASLSVNAGDGQTAAPGGKVVVHPSVLVRDASGRPVPGIAVTFAVDSGGGRIDGAGAVTGSDGIATAGDWTLGPAEGVNRLRVTTGTLTPVMFTASARFPSVVLADTTIGTAGGALVIHKAGDALDGLTIVIPNGSFQTPTQWTVAADSTPVPLPAGFSRVGPTLVIGNGLGYADSTITLKMPMQIGPDIAVAPFYFDPASGKLEAIPLVRRDATSSTLTTRHFSRDLMAIPGGAVTGPGAAVRAAAAPVAAFGAVRIVWVQTPRSNLVGTFSSTFRPGTDDWEFANNGDYISPGGDCEGMSVSAIYYHYYHKQAGEPGLFHLFDQSLPNLWDNVQGIRFTGSVQGDYAALFRSGVDQTRDLIATGVGYGLTTSDLTSTWILLTLKLNGQPVLLGLSAANAGHAVVAYSATSTGSHTDVKFSDPNFPGTARTMSFQSGILTPIPNSLKAGGATLSFDKAYAVAVSAEIPMAQISTRYHEFLGKTAGADRYPSQYRTEAFDNLSNSWVTLGSTWSTTDANLLIRHICPGCPTKTKGGAPDEQFVYLWDAAGANQIGQNSISNPPGTASYWVLLEAQSTFDPSLEVGFVDAQPLTVTYQPVTIDPDFTNLKAGQQLTFTANAGPLAVPGSTYTWHVDDGSPATPGGTSNTFTHTFTTIPHAVVTMTLRDPLGKKIAVAEARLNVHAIITIAPPSSPVNSGVPTTLTATVQGTIPPAVAATMSYAWTIFDAGGGEVDFTTPGPTLTYAFPKAGTYTVQLSSQYDGLPGDAAQDLVVDVQAVVALPVWRFTIMNESVTGTTAPDQGGILSQYVNVDVNSLMEPIRAVPRSGRLFYQAAPVTTGGQTYAAGVYVMGGYFNNTDITFGPGRPGAPLARGARPPYPDGFVDALVIDAATQAGDLNSGSFSGTSATRTRDLSIFGGVGGVHTVTHWAVTATKNGTTLTGKITFFLEQWVLDPSSCHPAASFNCSGSFAGTLKWDFPFTAVRVQ